jgi:hypothetical protein
MRNCDIFGLSEELARIKVNLEYMLGKKDLDVPIYNLQVFSVFPQTWSDTSCGFGGMAGQAISNAFTVVLEHEEKGDFYIFINGQFAYKQNRSNKKFVKDLIDRNVAGKTGKGKYLK